MVPHAEVFLLLTLCCIPAHIIAMPPECEEVGDRIDQELEIKQLCEWLKCFNGDFQRANPDGK